MASCLPSSDKVSRCKQPDSFPGGMAGSGCTKVFCLSWEDELGATFFITFLERTVSRPKDRQLPCGQSSGRRQCDGQGAAAS